MGDLPRRELPDLEDDGDLLACQQAVRGVQAVAQHRLPLRLVSIQGHLRRKSGAVRLHKLGHRGLHIA